MECELCGRQFPGVIGAPTQVCPHCGHETAQAEAGPRARVAPAVDPVGALGEAWRLAARGYVPLVLLFLPALAVEVGATFAIDAYARTTGLPLEGALTTGEQMRLLGVALPLYVLVFSVRLATWTLVAARVLDVVRGGTRLAGWPALLAPALLAGFVLTLLYSAGIVLLLVGFLVFLHWFLYVPAMIASGTRTLGSAFEASRRFAREHHTHGFTALVLLVAAVPTGLYFAAGLLPSPWGLATPPLIAWAFGPVVPLLAASYVAIARETSAAAPAPAPARGSTTCPRCRTLFAYTPTGSPVDVTCPACGFAGRVL